MGTIDSLLLLRCWPPWEYNSSAAVQGTAGWRQPVVLWSWRMIGLGGTTKRQRGGHRICVAFGGERWFGKMLFSVFQTGMLVHAGPRPLLSVVLRDWTGLSSALSPEPLFWTNLVQPFWWDKGAFFLTRRPFRAEKSVQSPKSTE